jgi:hypothetical protein
MIRVLTTSMVLLGVCALAACELGEAPTGGLGGGGGGEQMTVTLSSLASLDGWIRTDGNGATAGGQGLTGDLGTVANQGYRQFYSFDLSSIPAGSQIVSATLRLYQATVVGAPYTELGNVIVDHVDYGPTLEGTADFGVAPLAGNVGTLSSAATAEYKTLVVTARVQADVSALRTRSQYRLRFSTADFSNDAGSDFVQFTEAESPGGNNPQLVVIYREP